MGLHAVTGKNRVIEQGQRGIAFGEAQRARRSALALTVVGRQPKCFDRFGGGKAAGATKVTRRALRGLRQRGIDDLVVAVIAARERAACRVCAQWRALIHSRRTVTREHARTICLRCAACV